MSGCEQIDDLPYLDEHHINSMIAVVGAEVFSEVMGAVPKELCALSRAVRQAFDDDNLGEAVVSAHTLKGVASNAGAKRVAALAAAVEREARNGRFDRENQQDLEAAAVATGELLHRYLGL